VDALLKGRLVDVRATLEQLLEQVGVDEGDRRLATGEDPTDETDERTQDRAVRRGASVGGSRPSTLSEAATLPIHPTSRARL
jgi:hypothetical protein